MHHQAGANQPPTECKQEELEVNTHKNIWQCFENYNCNTLTTSTSDSRSKNDEANSAVDYKKIVAARKRSQVKQAFYSKLLEKYHSLLLMAHADNPLHWWKANIGHLKNLEPIVLKYLCFRPSTVASE